jgi:hypothetical protein
MLRLIAFFLLALSTQAFSEESSPREPEHKAEAAQTDNHHSAAPKQITVPANSPAPTIINISTGKHAGEESQCAKPKDWKEWGSFAWCRSWEALDAEKIIAAFTVILGIATWKLWRSTDALVKGAEETSERQLRAYVFAVAGRVRRFAVNEPVEIEVRFENTGQTPAYGVHHTMNIAMCDPPLPLHELDFTNPRKDAMGPRKSSSSFASFGPDYKLSQGHFAAVQSEEAAVWVYGEIRYEDAFGKPRWTKFRFIYVGDFVTDPPGGMATDTEGNDAT